MKKKSGMEKGAKNHAANLRCFEGVLTYSASIGCNGNNLQ
jgi:hypothetical protein